MVGQDETDDALLWFGSVFVTAPGADCGGFRPSVDAFVQMIGMFSGSGQDTYRVLIEPEPTPAATLAVSQNFIREPSGATPNASFVERIGGVAGASFDQMTSQAAPAGSPQFQWLHLAAPGLLVRRGEILWANPSNPPALGSFSFHVGWRGS